MQPSTNLILSCSLIFISRTSFATLSLLLSDYLQIIISTSKTLVSKFLTGMPPMVLSSMSLQPLTPKITSYWQESKWKLLCIFRFRHSILITNSCFTSLYLLFLILITIGTDKDLKSIIPTLL